MVVEGFIYPDSLAGFGNTGAQREHDHPDHEGGSISHIPGCPRGTAMDRKREHRDREHQEPRDTWGVGLTSILCAFRASAAAHCSREHMAGPYYSSYLFIYTHTHI